MSGVREGAKNTFRGVIGGVGEIARDAGTDIGDKYQEILTADATVSPPEGLTGTVETVEVAQEPAPEVRAPEINFDHC